MFSHVFYMVISFPVFSKDVMFSLTTASTEQSAKPFSLIYSHVKVHGAVPWWPWALAISHMSLRRSKGGVTGTWGEQRPFPLLLVKRQLPDVFSSHVIICLNQNWISKEDAEANSLLFAKESRVVLRGGLINKLLGCCQSSYVGHPKANNSLISVDY